MPVQEPRRPIEREVTPEVIHRHCGGYLAISPKGCAIQIGVTDDTAESVIAKFATTYARWIELSEMEWHPKHVSPAP